MQAEFDIYQNLLTLVKIKTLFTPERNSATNLLKTMAKSKMQHGVTFLVCHVHISIQRRNIYKVGVKSQMFVYIEDSCVEYMVHC